MSAHNARSGPRSHHTPRTAIRAAAAALIVLALLALAACSSPAANPSGSASPSADSFGSGGDRVTLTGAGSTFDEPFFAVAFAHYHQQHPGVGISYAAVGSSAGIAAFSARQADFGASDVPMTTAEQSAAKGGPSPRYPSTWAAKASPTTSASPQAPGYT
jgi:ABC-type phosphate transport system substrate-binding protein